MSASHFVNHCNVYCSSVLQIQGTGCCHEDSNAPSWKRAQPASSDKDHEDDEEHDEDEKHLDHQPSIGCD